MSSDSEPQSKPAVNIYGVNTIGKHVGQALFTAILLFLAAGTLAWPWGWVFVGVYTACWVGLSIALAIGNPGLLNQRGQRIKDATQGTKPWDLVILALYFVLVLTQPVVAGLDYRYAVSAPVTSLVVILGNGLLILGFVLFTWSMLANRYFEPSVRIQEARGQRAETRGPYRFVRHPGYTGVILQFLAIPVALGTWLAFIPGLAGAVLFVIRTSLEDHTLQAELPGYADYAQETRYRLIPGLW